MSFFTGFGVSALIYWGLNWMFPARGAAHAFEEVDMYQQGDSSLDEKYDDGQVGSDDGLDRKESGDLKDGMSVRTIPV